MALISSFSELIDDPQYFIHKMDGRKTAGAGLAGYFIGALSFFIFLRLFMIVPPGAYSFISILLAMMGIAFVFAGAIHLFLEITGCGGGALKLFLLFGATEPVWCALLPLGFLAKIGFLTPLVDVVLCLAAVIAVRMPLLKRLYGVSLNKALLALGLPYAALITAAFMLFLYAAYYLLWLTS